MKILAALVGLLVSVNCTKILDLQNYSGDVYDSSLTVKVGEKFQIVLGENPSTGFKWGTVDKEMEASGVKDLVKQTDSLFKSEQ